MATPRYRAMRILAIVVGAVSTMLLIAEAFAAIRSSEISNALALAYVADTIVWAPWSAIGVLIAARGIRTAGTTALAFSIATLGLNFAMANVEILNGRVNPTWQDAMIGLTGFIAARAFLRSCQLFPRPLTREDVLSPQASLLGMLWLQRLLAYLLRPWVTWAIAAVYAIANFLVPGAFGQVPLILLGLAFVRVFLRVGNSIVRRRVTWIAQTTLFFLAMFFVSSILQSLLRSAGVGLEARAWVYVAYCVPLGVGGVVSIAMTVFGAGAVNPSLVVKSTVVYGTTISLLLFALNVISSLLVDSVTHAFGLNDRLVAATLGALAGLLLEPLAKVLRRLLERAGSRTSKRAGSSVV
jgi:hypothetical protein